MGTKTPTAFQTSAIFLVVVISLLLIGILQGIMSPGAIVWINELVIILLPAILYARFKKINFTDLVKLKPINSKTFWLSVVIGLAAFPLFLFISGVVETILIALFGQFIELAGFLETTRTDSLNFFLFVTGIMVLAPFCEEVFFRGFVQQGLGGYQHRRGWVLAGFLFGAVHFGNGISNALGAIFLGLVLSNLAFKTASIWPTIIVHFIVNSLAAIFIHIPGFTGFVASELLVLLFVNPITLIFSLLVFVLAIRKLPKVTDPSSKPIPLGFKSILLIGISILLLFAIASGELFIRVDQSNLEINRISMGRLEDRFILANVEADSPSTMDLMINLQAQTYHGEITDSTLSP